MRDSMAMSIDERMALVMRNAEELVTEDELRRLLTEKEEPTAYIGFEPSGLVHFGWALVTQKIRDLCEAGFRVTIFWADWHARINDKLGGDLDNIRTCARYMEDCFMALGVPADRVVFRYASDLVADPDYWETVIKIGKVTSMARVKRTMTIMGRGEDDADKDTAKVLYPLMQTADIFFMDIDLAYAGMDQRRIHMLAKEVSKDLGRDRPLVALHTPLLPSLNGVDLKMSKSDPNNSINIHDNRDSIAKKIKKAYCPDPKNPGDNDMSETKNPMLMMAKYVIFPRNGGLHINRPDKYGGPIDFADYDSLKEAYYGCNLSPVDLKSGVVDELAKTLEPVSKYFEENPENYEAMVAVLKKLGKL